MGGRREENRANVERALLAAAKAELRTQGAAGLSVRSVARTMGMAPSALFRYISGRDDLLTLLIVDAYDALGDHVETLEASVPRDDVRGRWRALASAVRDWAIAHPHEYALLYGSPVPGFHARAAETNRAGMRITNLLAAIGREAPGPRPIPRPTGPQMADFVESAGVADIDPQRVADGLTAWTTLLGAVTAEVFEYLGPDAPYASMLFPQAVAVAEALMFGQPTSP